MTRFRPQRGGYAESMVEGIEVGSRAELAQRLGVVRIVDIKPYGGAVDARNGWSTHIVTAQVLPDGQVWVIGFTDGPLE